METKNKRHSSYRPEYLVYRNMLRRCFSSRERYIKSYRERGISVCERWLGKMGFTNFLNDVGFRPSKLHSLDRINNDGNYEPSNCRWTTSQQQARNRSSNTVLESNGKKKLLIEWAKELGVRESTILRRIERGWTIDRAVNEKPKENIR